MHIKQHLISNLYARSIKKLFLHQNFLYFSDIERMHRILGVELLQDFSVDETSLIKLLRKEFATDKHSCCIVEYGNVFDIRNTHASLCDFVFVATRDAAKVAEFLLEFSAEEVERKVVARIYEFLGVASLANEHECSRLIPHNAHAAPTCSHGVSLVTFFSGDKHPFATDSDKGIWFEFFWRDYFKHDIPQWIASPSARNDVH